MKGKSRALFLHAKKRAKERFGFELNRDKHRDIVSMIQGNSAKFVEKQSNRVSVWDVEYHGILMRVVYDKSRGQIITLLHKDGYLSPWEKLELERVS